MWLFFDILRDRKSCRIPNFSFMHRRRGLNVMAALFQGGGFFSSFGCGEKGKEEEEEEEKAMGGEAKEEGRIEQKGRSRWLCT